MKKVFWKFYFFYEYPGWIMHEVSHYIVFWMLKVLTAWEFLEYDRFEHEIDLYKYRLNGKMYYYSHYKLGMFLSMIVSIAPIVMFLLMLFILRNNPISFNILSFYSCTTGWFFMSSIDIENFNKNKQYLLTNTNTNEKI